MMFLRKTVSRGRSLMSLNCLTDVLILVVKGHVRCLYVATVTVTSHTFYMNTEHFFFF